MVVMIAITPLLLNISETIGSNTSQHNKEDSNGTVFATLALGMRVRGKLPSDEVGSKAVR